MSCSKTIEVKISRAQREALLPMMKEARGGAIIGEYIIAKHAIVFHYISNEALSVLKAAFSALPLYNETKRR